MVLKIYNTLTRKKEIFRPREKSIPLWETHWYQLRDNELLKLKGNLLKELINLGIEKAGNLNKFSKLIGMCYTDFWFVLKNQAKLVSIKKLRLLASYLGINYDYFNNKISEIRKGEIVSIKNPKFPFNLATRGGATLLGNITSDGCIYIDKKARGVKRTKYSAGTREELENFINNIDKVFGKVHFQKEEARNSVYLKIGSSIIGECLCKVGAPIGNKAEINCGVPWLIKEGSEDLKIAYLRTIFDDEGTPAGARFPYLTLSRIIHINNCLSVSQKSQLKKLESHMKERRFPTGHKIKSIDLTKLKRLENLGRKDISALIDLLFNIKPKLLNEESEMLTSLGIKNRIRNYNLSLTTNDKYSLGSELRIYRKADVLKFYKKINFGLSSKKEKIKNFLIKSNWI